MFDLKLDNRGDLVLLKSEQVSSKVKIDFVCTNTKAVKIDFYLDDFIATPREGVAIHFDINKATDQYVFDTVNDLKGIQQGCQIRLQTEVGDMKHNEKIGSYLEKIRHRELYNSLVQSELKTIAKNAIQDILPKATVNVEPVVQQVGDKYEQKAVLSIYDEGTVIAEYDAR